MCSKKMLVLFFVLFLTVNVSTEFSDEYIDPVIDWLLNGENSVNASSEDVTDDDPILISGIWKCGNCSRVTDSKLVYREDNDVDVDIADDDVDIQIGLSVQGMRCVTVAADKAGLVRKLTGACDGESVILHVKSARHFVVNVYS